MNKEIDDPRSYGHNLLSSCKKKAHEGGPLGPLGLSPTSATASLKLFPRVLPRGAGRGRPS